jgi:hypothetical protein
MELKTSLINFIEEILILEKDFSNFLKLFTFRHQMKHLMSEEEIKEKITNFLTTERIYFIQNHETKLFEDTFFKKIYDSFSEPNKEIFWKWLDLFHENFENSSKTLCGECCAALPHSNSTCPEGTRGVDSAQV